MPPKIVFVTNFPVAADFAREMALSGYDMAIAEARSAEYKAAIKDADYLVGFVDMLVDRQLFLDGPKLKLIQLLSAGYNNADSKRRAPRACRSATMAAPTRPRFQNTRSCSCWLYRVSW